MDDLQNSMTNFLSDGNNAQMLQNILNQMNGSNGRQQEEVSENSSQSGGVPDVSGLLNMLSQNGSGNNSSSQSQVQNQSGGLDMNMLGNLLGSLNGGSSQNNSQQNLPAQNSTAQNGGGLDMSALSSMLSGVMGNGNGGGSSGGQANSNSDFLRNLNIDTLMKVQKAMSDNGADDDNSNLLRAIKPHLSEGRRSKVDNAISLMKMTKLLPLLTESGLFGGKR